MYCQWAGRVCGFNATHGTVAAGAVLNDVGYSACSTLALGCVEKRVDDILFVIIQPLLFILVLFSIFL